MIITRKRVVDIIIECYKYVVIVINTNEILISNMPINKKKNILNKENSIFKQKHDRGSYRYYNTIYILWLGQTIYLQMNIIKIEYFILSSSNER